MNLFLIAQQAAEQLPGPVVDTLPPLTPLQNLVLSAYGLMILIGFLMDVPVCIRWWKNPGTWQKGVETLLYRPWERISLVRVLALMLLLFFVGQSLVFLVPSELMDHEGFSGAWVVLQGLLMYIPILVLIGWDLKKRGVNPWRGFGISRSELGRGIWLGALFYIGFLPIVLLYALLYYAFLDGIGVEVDAQAVAEVISGAGSPLMQVILFIIAAVFAPLVEELLFRGIALPILVRKWGITRGVLIVSAGFALIHFHVPSLVPLFVLAIGLSLAYIYSGTIIAPMAMHAFFNGVNVIVMTQVPEVLIRGGS